MGYYIEDGDIVKECHDEDQLLEISNEGVIVEEYFVEYFVKEAKEEYISSPMLEEDGTFEDEDKGAQESEAKEVNAEDLEKELEEEAHEELEALTK